MPRGERACPPGVHTPHANYSHAARVGNTLYLAGQIPLDADGKLVGRADAEAQAEQCLKNVKALVEHFGGSMDDVVKITTYITDLAYRPLVSRPRDRAFSAPYPASTLVVVKGLADPEYLVEIEALAILG
ncbi:MAG: RidA family protein [Chloroflexi bacterium]|nr:RidA family protein [Chloroflexota bacterium]